MSESEIPNPWAWLLSKRNQDAEISDPAAIRIAERLPEKSQDNIADELVATWADLWRQCESGGFSSDVQSVCLPSSLGSMHQSFIEKGDLTDGALLFINCLKYGVYPPADVLEWISEAFRGWIESDGRKSLDELLGIKPARGKSPLPKQRRKKAALSDAAHIIHLLVESFGLSAGKAAELVAARSRAWGEKPPTAEWLMEVYQKEHRKRLLTGRAPSLLDTDPEARRRFIESFPEEDRRMRGLK